MVSSGKILYTQLLISVSVVSSLLFLYYHSSLVPLLLQCYDYILSNYSIKLFTYKSERNYIFLLCNGILVLIMQTSGLISKITPLQSDRKSVENDQTTMMPKTVETPKKVEVFEEEKVRDEVIVDDHSKDREEDHENIIVVDVQEDDYQAEDGDEDEDDGDGDDNDEGIDHELNRKCEDFIKKMKQEIMGA